jgi:hypothetical protein
MTVALQIVERVLSNEAASPDGIGIDETVS